MTDNLTAIFEPIVYKNVGASTSRIPVGLHGQLQLYFYLYFLRPRIWTNTGAGVHDRYVLLTDWDRWTR
jgi:hypothetical protein